MIDRQTVFEIHCLQRRGLSIRQLSRQPGINRQTVQKYLVLFFKNLNMPQKAPAEALKAVGDGIGKPMS
jgi:transposase